MSLLLYLCNSHDLQTDRMDLNVSQLTHLQRQLNMLHNHFLPHAGCQINVTTCATNHNGHARTHTHTQNHTHSCTQSHTHTLKQDGVFDPSSLSGDKKAGRYKTSIQPDNCSFLEICRASNLSLLHATGPHKAIIANYASLPFDTNLSN